MKIGIFTYTDFLVNGDSNLVVVMDRSRRPRLLEIEIDEANKAAGVIRVASIWKLVSTLDVEQSYDGLGYILKTVGIVDTSKVQKDPGS